jgi:hypothetical protein
VLVATLPWHSVLAGILVFVDGVVVRLVRVGLPEHHGM